MTDSFSPVSEPKQFENQVADLLVLKGVRKLTREKQFPSKKADLYFEIDAFNSTKRYVVECKSTRNIITQSEIAKIASQYDSIIRAGEATDLLIVGWSPIAPSAQSYVDGISHIAYATVADLRNSIIDFRGYLTGLRAKFLSDPANNYYVMPSGSVLDNDANITPVPNLLKSLLKDIRKGDRPTIVLGSYGIGKTTLSQRIFLHLMRKWERFPDQPIPIYVSLDLMRREQSLEGLLGTLFTSISPASGYNFNLFCEMNEKGYFILILDGMDEMRHRLPKDQFLYNIDQLSLLSESNPRTIVLGRPSAFMDEDEYRYVVKGYHTSTPFRPTGTSGYREVHMGLLSPQNIERFIEKFCAYRYPGQRIARRAIAAFSGKAANILGDLPKRPVQLWMLMEVFPHIEAKSDLLTKDAIYALFVAELIRREKSKKAGATFSTEDHLTFGRCVAWWLWTQGATNRVEAKQIGSSVFEPFSDRGDLETLRGSLVSASFLTTEGGTHLHFPHRSLQEYFVAQEILVRLRTVRTHPDALPTARLRIRQLFTPEVVDFLASALTSESYTLAVEYLDRVKGYPESVLALTAAGPRSQEIALSHLRRTGSISSAWICTFDRLNERSEIRQQESSYATLRDVLFAQITSRIDRFQREIRYGGDEAFSDIASYLLCLLILGTRDPNALERIWDSAHSFLTLKRSTQISKQAEKKLGAAAIHPPALEFVNRLVDSFASEPIRIDWAYKFLRSRSSDAPFVLDWIVGDTIRISNVGLLNHLPWTAQGLALQRARKALR